MAFTRALSEIQEKSCAILLSGFREHEFVRIICSEMTGGVVLLCPLHVEGVYKHCLVACERLL